MRVPESAITLTFPFPTRTILVAAPTSLPTVNAGIRSKNQWITSKKARKPLAFPGETKPPRTPSFMD